MPQRVNLPGASELFRPTTAGTAARPTAGTPRGRTTKAPKPEPAPTTATGRVRHDEKMTVYVSSEELIALEQARLTLRAGGLAVDRGRFIRAALASALEDLATRGLKADIVRRLGD